VTIGVYDSGLGGLTVLAALRAAGIAENIIYFADQAHVPYGDKSDAELQHYLHDNLAWLEARGVDIVAMGCNTSCAVASRAGWPKTTFRFPIQDLIQNSARTFATAPYRHVAVIATAATVRSGAYGNAIRAAAPHIQVEEIAAPALVPLVERGESESAEARAAVAGIVAQFPSGIDAIVYGCTHYPLLDAHFAALAPAAARIDPALEQARAVLALGVRTGTGGTTHYVTNGDPIAFEANVRRWTGDLTGIVTGLVAT
jgi:glutamate racemase